MESETQGGTSHGGLWSPWDNRGHCENRGVKKEADEGLGHGWLLVLAVMEGSVSSSVKGGNNHTYRNEAENIWEGIGHRPWSGGIYAPYVLAVIIIIIILADVGFISVRKIDALRRRLCWRQLDSLYRCASGRYLLLKWHCPPESQWGLGEELCSGPQ